LGTPRKTVQSVFNRCDSIAAAKAHYDRREIIAQSPPNHRQITAQSPRNRRAITAKAHYNRRGITPRIINPFAIAMKSLQSHRESAAQSL
jgi:hypothetical protein